MANVRAYQATVVHPKGALDRLIKQLFEFRSLYRGHLTEPELALLRSAEHDLTYLATALSFDKSGRVKDGGSGIKG